MRLGDVKTSGLEHVELPLELSSGSTTTRQSSLVNGGEEVKDAEEEEEEVQQVSERAPTLPSRTTSAPRIRVTPQQRQGLHVPAAEEEGRGKRRTQAPNRLTYEALGKPAKSALAGAALMVGEDEESDYEECAFAFFSPVEMPGESATLKEALESCDAEEWKKAMESDYVQVALQIKSDADGKIERYKSRLVAKGYQQKEKVEYKELFAPVVKPTTLRTLLAGAAIKGWVVKQMDVTTTFLNGVLEEEIFMAQPEGFDDGSGRVLRLKKALYGLNQAHRQWYLKLRGVLEEIGFTPSSADHSLFMLGEGEQRSFMVVYVDDILIFSPSSDLVKEVMLKLQDKFKCKALGDLASPLLAPSPYTEQIGGLTECCAPASRLASPVRPGRHVPRPRPPPIPGTHAMTLRPSSIPLRVPLPAPPDSSLPGIPDPESDRVRATRPIVSRLLATALTDPSFETAAVCALVAQLLDFAAASRLDYTTALVAESTCASHPSVGGECALGMDVLEDRVKRPTGSPPVFKARYHSFLQGSLHEEIWLRRPPGFTGSFLAGTQWSLRWLVHGLRQAPCEWHDTQRTTLAALGFAPSTADPLLFLLTDSSLPPFYVLVYVDALVFASPDTEALTLVKCQLQKRHTCTDLSELRSCLGLQITRDRARRTITLTQSHMVQQVLQRFGFQFSSPQPTPLSTSHLLSAPPSDEFVEPSGQYPELVGYLMYLMTCTRPDLAYPLSLLACYVAPGRHQKVHWDAAMRLLCYLCSTSGMGLVLGGRGPVVLTCHADASSVDDSATHRSSQGYTFSFGSGSDSWRSTRSSSVLSSSCEAEIYAGAMAAQELR
ncbi:unnamed protein product [Closterium sp. NIES-53]